jgi:hypothetical protein
MKKITLFFAATLIAAAGFAQTRTMDELMVTFEQVKNSPNDFTEFFTVNEMAQINTFLKNRDGVEQVGADSSRSAVTAFGWESQGNGFGSYAIASPDTWTMVSAGAPTADGDFEGAGAIDPADNANAIAADNVGNVYSLDVATGVYANLGSTGLGGGFTGLHYGPQGALYGADSENLYLVETDPVSATLIGNFGVAGSVMIALAINDDGVGYTYDIITDLAYSIDLATGVATELGSIGFDASFGQGAYYDQSTDTVLLAAFNAGGGNLSELRSLDTTTGATTLLAEILPGALTQVAWSSTGNDIVLGTENSELSQVAIFPNPASEVLNIKVPSTIEVTSVTLYDVLGKATNVSLSNGQINVSGLARGIYILNVNTTAGTLTEKVIIE